MACSTDEINNMGESEEEIPELIPITDSAPLLHGIKEIHQQKEETGIDLNDGKIHLPVDSNITNNQETWVGNDRSVDVNADDQPEIQQELETKHETKGEEQESSCEVKEETGGQPPKKRRMGMCNVIKKEKSKNIKENVTESDPPADPETTRTDFIQQNSERDSLDRIENGGDVCIPAGNLTDSNVKPSSEDQNKDLCLGETDETKPEAPAEIKEEMTGSLESCVDIPAAEEKIDDNGTVSLQDDTVKEINEDGSNMSRENPEDKPGCSPATNTDDLQKETSDKVGPEGDPDISDSQLNDVSWTEEDVSNDASSGSAECMEDATGLVCGLIQELSGMNRTVMAADRELTKRGGRPTSRNSK